MIKLLVALALLPLVPPAWAQCPASDSQAVTNTVQAMFDAAAADDASKLELIFAPEFYAFDGGKRYDAASFQDTLRRLHQSGTRTAWHVTSPDVHISCGTAWIAYVNQGTFTESGKVTQLTWLESADLDYTNSSWHIAFLESARASDTALVGVSNASAPAQTTEQEIMRLERETYAAIAAKTTRRYSF